MSLGDRLIKLRKEKGLSQEEVADKLNVTRQTISKWETNQSTPDFDKIIPLCELYEITTDELFTEKKKDKQSITNRKQIYGRNLGIAVGLYIISVAVMIFFGAYFQTEVLSVCLFFIIVGIATALIIYNAVVYGEDNKEKEKKEKLQENKTANQICHIIDILGLIVYFIVSFATMAWHITWIIFLIVGLCNAVVKLIFSIEKEDKNE